MDTYTDMDTDSTNIIILNKLVIDLVTAKQYATISIGEMDSETILKTPEGLFILARSRASEMQYPEYTLMTTANVLHWLEGKAGMWFADIEEAVQDLGLSRPAKHITPTPPATPDASATPTPPTPPNIPNMDTIGVTSQRQRRETIQSA